MKLKIIAIGAIMLLALSIFSCTTNAVPKKLPNLFLRDSLINGRLGSVKIIDNRKDTSSTPIKVPAFAVKTKSYEAIPSLSLQQEEMLKKHVQNYMREFSDLNPIDVKIYIQQGEKRIDASATRVSEHTIVDLKIELLDIVNNTLVMGYGIVNYDLPMINATVKHLDLLFDITLKNAIHMCLTKVNEVQKK